MNMSYGRTTQSQPITIKNRNNTTTIGQITPKNSSSSTTSSYLPLSTSHNKSGGGGTSPGRSSSSASISRRGNERKESISSNTSGGGGGITPSSGTQQIFPFSPSSPMKHFIGPNLATDPLDINTMARKCHVDATTGTVRLTEEDEDQITPTATSSSGLLSSYQRSDPTKVLNTDYPSTPSQLEALSNNYADMTLGTPAPRKLSLVIKKDVTTIEYPDYVNCSPSDAAQVTARPISYVPKPKVSDDGSGDYAFMDPKKIGGGLTTMTTTTKKSPLVTINTNQEKFQSFGSAFKPISSNTDDLVIRNTNYVNKAGSPKPAINSVLNRQLSEKRGLSIDGVNPETMGYEILQVRSDNSIQNKKIVLSRPNSVNSEKITSTNNCNLNRPNSANSDRLPVISSSSSSSTLCGSSSSSTLCGGGSKSQSPSSSTSTIRPQSLGDIGGGSRPESVTDFNTGTTTTTTTLSTLNAAATSRPPSVSSERELHYASLDLPTKTDDGIESSSGSPSPNTGGSGSGSAVGGSQSQQPAFTYAKIDFVKSESLKATKSN